MTCGLSLGNSQRWPTSAAMISHIQFGNNGAISTAFPSAESQIQGCYSAATENWGMAAACTSAPTWVATGLPRLSPARQQQRSIGAPFLGLRLAKAMDSVCVKNNRNGFEIGKSAPRITCELNPSLVISLSTGASLFLGRFVFLDFQRENVAKQGLPQQNGLTHFEAGDTRAKEYVDLLKTNDPAGFNIVDVLAWGSIGHIVAYYILATASNGYDPKFF